LFVDLVLIFCSESLNRISDILGAVLYCEDSSLSDAW
jgi:hypothetical protein